MARRFVLKPDDTPPQALSIDYRGELNAQQAEAATSGGGALLIVAGAGTGKTRTLVYRVAYLVETGTPPEQIVLLTFTRRAAQQMLTRAASLLDGRCSRVVGGTFHAFCLGVLRRYAARIGYPERFSILDASDASDVVDVVRTAHNLHRANKRFPRKQTLYNLFSTAANRSASLAEVLEASYPQFLEYRDVLETLHEGYETYKRQHGLMDYDDLLVRTLELFDREPDVERRVAAECRHMLVDEYQDTNRLQAALVERFASVHGNVTAVGDDAQSIYRFRGADPGNIFAFPERFPGARILKLEQNYRSTQPILDLANHLIERAHRRYEKRLFSDRNEGERPAIVPAPDDRFESRFVRQVLLQLREEGVPLHRMAVLFRSSYNSFDLEVELNRHNIPFVKYGGLKLSEAAHVKDVVAYLRVAENPQDAAAWNRILQLLEGVGPKTAQELIGWITSASEDPFRLESRPFSPRYAAELQRLFDMLRTIRREATPLTEAVEHVLNYYQPILRQRYYEDYPKREQDLEHLVGLTGGFTDRATFLSSLALDPIELTALEAEAQDADEPPLVLSTIHSAKGLEFHTVFLIHALDGILPSAYSLKDPDALDEELRLLYVAVTRAEENLLVSYPVIQYGRFRGDYLSKPSRFLDDLPERLVEEWQLVEETAPAPPESAPAPRQLPADTRRESSVPARGEEADDGLPF